MNLNDDNDPKPSTNYNRQTLRAAVAELRTIAQTGSPTTSQFEAIAYAARFLEDTAAVLDLQAKGYRDRAAHTIIERKRSRNEQRNRRR